MENTETKHVLYLIRCIGVSKKLCYAEHGEMGGIDDAIGYTEPQDAMKFRTREEAQEYIDTKLPEWGKTCHYPAEYCASDFMWHPIGTLLAFCSNEVIPDQMLQPTPDLLRIWLR